VSLDKTISGGVLSIGRGLKNWHHGTNNGGAEAIGGLSC
jgi:hypothetical protein